MDGNIHSFVTTFDILVDITVVIGVVEKGARVFFSELLLIFASLKLSLVWDGVAVIGNDGGFGDAVIFLLTALSLV